MKPKQRLNIILYDIWKDLNYRNLTHIMAIVGGLGVGKSYVGLRICELISHRFSLDNVVFNSKDFLRLLNSGQLKKGDAILWDEISISQYSRDFMSLQNKLINHALTTFRTKNILLCFSTPSLKFVDVGVSRLCHSVVQPISINRKKEINIVKFKRVRKDALTGKVLFPYPRVRSKHDCATPTSVRVKKMIFKKSKFAKEYEKIRKEFADDLAKNIEHEILEQEAIQIRKKVTAHDIAKKLNPDKHKKPYANRQIWDRPKIEVEFGIGDRTVKKAISIYENNTPTPLST